MIDTDLTRYEDRVLAALRAHTAAHGYHATVRELQAIAGIRSTSTVHRALDGLVRAGYVDRDAGIARSIRLRGVSV
jgi:DNA-binding IclR family transcriptional regulator